MTEVNPIDRQHVQTSGLGFTGQSVKRVEDERFLVGQGRFVADVNPEGVLHTPPSLRSPFASRPHHRRRRDTGPQYVWCDRRVHRG